MSRPSTHADVVQELGGPRVVADLLNVEPVNNAYHWCKPGRRIPAEYWFAIEDLPAARARGITAKLLASMPVNPIQRVRAA